MSKKFIRNFGIKIQSLSNNSHNYEFKFDQNLINYFSDENEIKNVEGVCNLQILKSEHMLEVLFMIKGETVLNCDRSLKEFTQSINLERKILFKFGEEDEEVSDEMIVINRNKSILNMAKYIYEFFILEVPAKRLHPNLKNEDNIDNFVYTTKKNKIIDPRLDPLNKLK